jgi:hypothetical protein
MNTYHIGKNKLIKDTNKVGLIEAGLARITYPMSFTTEYFNIEQDFYCESDNIPTFVQGLPHSLYPNSFSVSQSSATLVTTGLARFTRKYVQFPSTVIEQPSTASITYPSIANGVNYDARGIKTVKGVIQVRGVNGDYFDRVVDVPAVTDWYRKNSVTRVIPVIQQISFIYMGNTLEERNYTPQGISAGTRISGKIVSSVEYDAEDKRWIIKYEDGQVFYMGENTTVKVEVPTYNPSSINVDEPFRIIDNYEGHSGAEVEFVDDFTTPSKANFLAGKDEDKLLFASQITHIEGYLYMKKNIYGKIQ